MVLPSVMTDDKWTARPKREPKISGFLKICCRAFYSRCFRYRLPVFLSQGGPIALSCGIGSHLGEANFRFARYSRPQSGLVHPRVRRVTFGRHRYGWR